MTSLDAVVKRLSMLSARGCNMQAVRGGIPELTSSDIAAAFLGVPDGPYYLAMLKYVRDEQVQPRLFYSLYDRAVKLSVKHKWDHSKEERGTAPIRKLCRLAIFEIVNPGRCGGCRGTGLYNDQRPCVTCSGSGLALITDDVRRQCCGISEQRWPLWRRRYDRIYVCVQGWDIHALREVAKKLGNDT